MTPENTAILGTRGSRLALAQAEECAASLRAAGIAVEIRIIRTTSEHHPETPLAVIDQRDVFTRQLDEALLSGEIDLAVHSLKDVPTEPPEWVVLAAVTRRRDPSDVLVSDGRHTLEDLPQGAVVATSSQRRRAQLLYHRPDLEVVGIRGNVDTRVRKMREGAADAVVLARAGLERLGLDAPHTVIPPDVMLPAVGQGALAVAVRREQPAARDRAGSPEPPADGESRPGGAEYAADAGGWLPRARRGPGRRTRRGCQAPRNRGVTGRGAGVPG